MNTHIENIRKVLRLIRFEHSVFALPFALISMMLAAEGFPPLHTIVLIILACVFARSAAMAFNRIADLKFDALNPRTQHWELPEKKINVTFVAGFVAINCVLFIIVARLLNPLAFYLSPVALIVLIGYSYTKRFTWLTHFILGGALGLAPAGAWIAIRGDITLIPVTLGLAVLLWTAGFDVIYACQDVEFDKTHCLHSIPKQFGIKTALIVSALVHCIAFGFFLILFFIADLLGAAYLIGVGLVAVLLLYEHAIVTPKDLSRVNVAFFTVNGIVSLMLFFFALVDILHSMS